MTHPDEGRTIDNVGQSMRRAATLEELRAIGVARRFHEERDGVVRPDAFDATALLVGTLSGDHPPWEK